MILFDFPELAFAQIAMIVLSGVWLLKRNDEIPLLISSFLCYVASYRYWAVSADINNWVNITHFGFQPITHERATIALGYIVFGEICLLGVYCLFQTKRLPALDLSWSNYAFFNWLRPKLLLLGVLCLPLVISVRGAVFSQVQSGRSLAFQVSGYLYLIPLMLVGIAILLVALWKFGGLPTLWSKLLVSFILFNLFNLTFQSSGRFQFIGWIIAAGIIWSSTYRPVKRLAILTMAVVLAVSLFAAAGAMRGSARADADFNQAAWQRAFSAEDANMLDGFVLIQQVYPDRLEFSFGMEHVEVLLRPIPRAIWPDKPVGGYMNKLGLIDADSGFTLGISPSILGSFYAEAGLVGILFWCIVYGFTIAKIVTWSVSLQPFPSIVVRAMLAASLIPLLRGGDLPGVYAWIGMAFWPCFLVLWLRRHQLRQQFFPVPPYLYSNPYLHPNSHPEHRHPYS